jgi:hypothetical protein
MSAKVSKKGKRKRRTQPKTKAEINKKRNKAFIEARRKLLIDALKDKARVMMVISCGHYLRIFYRDGSWVDRYGSLKKACWLLSNRYFFKPRENTLVNLNHFLKFEDVNGEIWMLFSKKMRAKICGNVPQKVKCVNKYLSGNQFIKDRKNARL